MNNYQTNFLVILIFLYLSVSQKTNAQMNAVKYIPSYNSDFLRNKPLDFDLNSYGFAYERVINDHASLEVVFLRSRIVALIGGFETKKLNGFGGELRYRYYFQTNPNFITFSPFEFYLAPTVGYTQMQTATLNDFHEIRNFTFGAIVGYHLILELYEDGFSLDMNAGVNGNMYNAQGYINKKGDVKVTPRVGLSFGYTF